MRQTAIFLLLMLHAFAMSAERGSIRSGELWPDTDGRHINAHGGGILLHEGTYYWYGGPKADLTFGAQSTFILPVGQASSPNGRSDAQESRNVQYIFMADIWRPRHPSDARYVWLPIAFEDGRPVVRWQEEWSP